MLSPMENKQPTFFQATAICLFLIVYYKHRTQKHKTEMWKNEINWQQPKRKAKNVKKAEALVYEYW